MISPASASGWIEEYLKIYVTQIGLTVLTHTRCVASREETFAKKLFEGSQNAAFWNKLYPVDQNGKVCENKLLRFRFLMKFWKFSHVPWPFKWLFCFLHTYLKHNSNGLFLNKSILDFAHFIKTHLYFISSQQPSLIPYKQGQIFCSKALRLQLWKIDTHWSGIPG